MTAQTSIPINGKVDLIFSGVSVKTGQPVPNAKITNQTVSLTNPSISSFIQDTSNPNIFHFTGLQAGTTNINCSAVITV